MLYDENLLNGEQQKIEDCYKQIGLRYYAYYKDDPAPEFMDLIAAIRESKRVMSEHRAEVLRANGKMICPNCGQQVAITALFCTSCGLRIRQADAPAPAAAPVAAAAVGAAVASVAPAIPSVPDLIPDIPDAPAVEEPVVEEPVVEEPVVEEPVVEEPVVEEPAVEEPVVEEPVVEESVVEEPVVEEPVVEEPVVEEPVVEESAAEEPVIEKTVSDDLGFEEPSFDALPVSMLDAAPTRIFDPKADEPDDDIPMIPEPKPSFEKAEPEAAEQSVCPKCGTALPPDCAFCIECGAPIASRRNEQHEIYSDSTTRFCTECGMRITDPEAVFCNNCGNRLDSSAGGKAVEPTPSAPSEKRCPFCGFTTSDPEMMFCIECGSKLM